MLVNPESTQLAQLGGQVKDTLITEISQIKKVRSQLQKSLFFKWESKTEFLHSLKELFPYLHSLNYLGCGFPQGKDPVDHSDDW